MYKQLLRMELRDLSPDAKFFLVKFALLSSAVEGVWLYAESMRKLIGMSSQKFRSSRDELVRLGYLTRDKPPRQDRASKYRYRYYLQSNHLGLSAGESKDHHHSGRIALLLGYSEKELDRGESLTPANILLLAVLMVHADECGVVDALPTKALSKLTGLSGNQIRVQQYKLIKLCYLRSVVAGISARYVSGRVPSAYFLNLNHPLWVDAGLPSLGVLVWLSNGAVGEDARRARREGRSKSSAFYGWDDPVAIELVRGLQVMRDFSSNTYVTRWAREVRDRPEAWAYQEYKLLEYASWLLSHCFNSLEEGSASAEFLERIDQQLVQVSSGKLTHTWGEPIDRQALIKYLSQVALDMAREMKGVCFEAGHTSDGKIYRILSRPCAATEPKVVLLMYQGLSPSSSSRNCYLVERLENGAFNVESWDNEKEISLQKQYELGLLTSPQVGPRKYKVKSITFDAHEFFEDINS